MGITGQKAVQGFSRQWTNRGRLDCFHWLSADRKVGTRSGSSAPQNSATVVGRAFRPAGRASARPCRQHPILRISGGWWSNNTTRRPVNDFAILRL